MYQNQDSFNICILMVPAELRVTIPASSAVVQTLPDHLHSALEFAVKTTLSSSSHWSDEGPYAYQSTDCHPFTWIPAESVEPIH
jgi:hypothetical protein